MVFRKTSEFNADKAFPKIKRLYENEGRSTKQIAKILNVPLRKVYAVLIGGKIELRPETEPRKHVEDATLKRLYVDEKLSLNKIAKLLKTEQTTIERELRRLSIPILPKYSQRRSMRELDSLEVGDSITLSGQPRPRFFAIYRKASIRNMKITVRHMDRDTIMVRRIS